MIKQETQNKTELRKHLREFVNDIINTEYASANANLTLAVKERIKVRVAKILEEN